MDATISGGDRMRAQLEENRTRYERDGVSILNGSRSERIMLPIDSRFEIFVRPAYHHDEHSEFALGRRTYVVAAVLATMVTALLQAAFVFHH